MNALKGKKTYIAAGLLALVGVGLIGLRQTSLGLMAICQAGAMVGLGDRVNRHQSEILQAIQDAGRVAVDMKMGETATFSSDVTQMLKDGARLTNAAMVRDCVGTVASGLPSSEDLDAVAKDEQAKAATAGRSATGNASLPATGAKA